MLQVRAPAKLNLYLRVRSLRHDGFHEIETLYERIDLADTLTFEHGSDGVQLTCSDVSLSCGSDNLVLRAAQLLHEVSGTPLGARIHLQKRIPVAAGLGGGSSDAAAALVGLNLLWELGLQQSKLIELASELGSDVPFFLCESPVAIGTGRGEVCEPIAPPAEPLSHVLVTPPERLSTAEIYRGWKPVPRNGLTVSAPSISIVAHALRNGSLGELAVGLWNDLEPEANRRCPRISRIQTHLRELGCLGTRVSGSGPSVFGLCRTPAHAQRIATELRQRMAPYRTTRVDIVQTDQASSGIMTSAVAFGYDAP